MSTDLGERRAFYKGTSAGTALDTAVARNVRLSAPWQPSELGDDSLHCALPRGDWLLCAPGSFSRAGVGHPVCPSTGQVCMM